LAALLEFSNKNRQKKTKKNPPNPKKKKTEPQTKKTEKKTNIYISRRVTVRECVGWERAHQGNGSYRTQKRLSNFADFQSRGEMGKELVIHDRKKIGLEPLKGGWGRLRENITSESQVIRDGTGS